MMLRSAHHSGVTPSVSLTWRNSMNIVLVSSTGTIQRLIIGPLNGCSWWPSSQIGATCCRLGRNRFHHPRPDVVPHPAGRNGHHAHRRLNELQFRQHAKLIGEYGAADD